MDTYKGKINEFVDWVSGDNSWTGRNVTNGQQVSGESIRKLLQERLKTPFVMKEDPQNNKYRMFSSEEAYQLWAENPSDNAELELFNFVRPSDYKLTFIGLNNSNKYIRLGDKDNVDARIQFQWDIRNDEGLSNENLQVTYTITNESTGTSSTFTRWYNTGEAVNFSIYQYLKSGLNNVAISGIGVENGSRNSTSFNITVLELNVSSNFQFYKKYTNGDFLTIPCTFTRNDVSGTARIYYVIDAGLESEQSWTTDVLSNSGIELNVDKVITLNLKSGQHTLQIYAEGTYNDGRVTVNTNLLYYTFVISSEEISTQKYICIGTEFNNGTYPINDFTMYATQYLQQTLHWGYYTEALQSDSKITVVWKLYRNTEDKNPIVLSTMTGNTQTKSSDLQYVPIIYSEYDQNGAPLTYISAQFGATELLRIPVQIVQNTDFSVHEVIPYAFKLSAYGKTNSSTEKDQWEYNGVNTTFTNIQWNQNSGWYENSFRVSTQGEYATINYASFADYYMVSDNEHLASGKTIEIEFETEKVDNDNDILIMIGTPNQARIEITPTEATLFANGNVPVIHTNYKSNERIKLSFILNPVTNSSDKKSGLAFIVNNGVLERASGAADGTYNNNGTIKIGGTNSGVRVYTFYVYDRALSYTDSYDNFLYNSDDKAEIFDRNNIVGQNGEISFDLCKNKIDTILIFGDLSRILNQNAMKDESESEVTFERICPFDNSKNFRLINARIRKHGQSTLNYPVASMKIWMNKSTRDEVVPTFELAPQEQLSLNKNRYRMKSDSIPANKFVLQANYADSSGVHNGGLERLIQNSWYNAKVDGKYVLRTLPQLFTSISSADKSQYGLDHVWNDYFPNKPFPYKLRISPDSFPCVVFYKNTGDDTQTFLGQYVFMEDKKSDFNYGERSIYKIQDDPFCLTVQHAKEDTDENLIWDNENVLRMEVIESNNIYSSYMTPITSNNTAWKNAFEMIYPDPDDFKTPEKYDIKVQPFIDWYNWIVSTRNNQAAFEAHAEEHLDLYKMAAYYIFCYRFGLVDSMERNAQIKTYDGQHFHYEPWDMDIALGNKNDGGIAYDPPIDRNTKLPGSISTYAFSGRSADEDTGNIVTSNWLWDALENWTYWTQEIVPAVANALYNAEGEENRLTYNNICKMFDENYANAWCETIYNKSGDFKYIQSRPNNEWLSWLQGARMSHRHWWLSTSMDYYDAKWFCGDYKLHSVYITANVSIGNNFEEEGEEGISGVVSSDKQITITPNKGTYIVIQKDYNTIYQTEQPVTSQNPLVYTVPVMNTKNPFHIYGANYIESIDLTQIANGLDSIDFSGVYSEVLGSPLKNINIGTALTEYGSGYRITVAQLGGGIRGNKGAFENLQNLNVRGQRNFTSIRDLIYENDISSLQNIYAMGSGITSFYSSESGNVFNKLELPSDITVFSVNNTTWNTLEFWNCEIEGSQGTLTQVGVPSTLQNIILSGTSCQNLNSINLIKQWIAAIDAAGGDFSNYTFNADNINWGISLGNSNLLTYDELSKIAQMQGTLRGYILLKGENAELTTQQLTQIKEWFGDSVFDRNSSGLIVDHTFGDGYTKINIGGDVIIENNEFYIREGGRASLNSTRFTLAEDAVEIGSWTVSYTNITDVQETFTRIQERGISIVQIGGYTYLQTSESQAGGNYDIKVWYSNGSDAPTNIILHVIGVTYPSNIEYVVDTIPNKAEPRESSVTTTIYLNGTQFDIYLNLDSLNFTATVKNIQHTISRGSNIYVYNTKLDSVDNNWSDLQLDVVKNSNKKGLRLECSSGLPVDSTIYTYNIESIIGFASGKSITVNHMIQIMDDYPVVTSAQLYVLNALKTRWNAKYNVSDKNIFYRSDLLNLDGTLTFDTQLLRIVTANGDSLFNYIPSIQGLVFEGCSVLVNNYNSQNLFVFDNMPELELLNISGCTSLNTSNSLPSIDLTHCPKMTTVITTGTNINIILPISTGIQTYTLGKPTQIELNSPTRLTLNGVTIADESDINSLDLIDIPIGVNGGGFTMFGKIMNL